MDPDLTAVARQYRAFAEEQADGSSPALAAWARGVGADEAVLARIATLPPEKQQPNLVFAAARWHGIPAGDVDALRRGIVGEWEALRATILQRATQTNEPARGAVLALGLSRIRGPIALLELGSSAGLCLRCDRYSYRFSDGTALDPIAGPSPVRIPIELTGALPAGLAMPQVVWRLGLDRHPLDPADPDTRAWLTTLVWPEHAERRRRLTAALDLAVREPVAVVRGDLLRELPDLLARVPSGATVVVMHAATLAYLDAPARAEAVAAIRASGSRWLSFEGRGVAPGVAPVRLPRTPNTLFTAALDGRPYAVANGHGDHLTLLDEAAPVVTSRG